MIENKIKGICEEVFKVCIADRDISTSKDYILIVFCTQSGHSIHTINKVLQIVLDETGCTGSFTSNRAGFAFTFLKPLVENENDIT